MRRHPSTHATDSSHRWRSEKGRYLSGLLDLFGGLHPATSCLEERSWRRMVDLLSGRTAHTDAKRLEEVGNALRKRLGANRAQFYEDSKAVTWLANYVLKVARSLPAPSRDLEFCVFEEHAKREMEDFNARRAGQEPWVYSQADLINALADLTDCGVLPSCPHLLDRQHRSNRHPPYKMKTPPARPRSPADPCAASRRYPPPHQIHLAFPSLSAQECAPGSRTQRHPRGGHGH